MSEEHPHYRSDDEMDSASEDEAILDPADAAEEIEADGDAPMESDSEGDDDAGDEDMQIEFNLQNDSVAHFDGHTDSIFCIAQHPVHANIVATGGGDDVGFIFDVSDIPEVKPEQQERESLKSLFKLEGHTDSINAITFTYPKGQYVATAGLDGKLRVWQGEPAGKRWKFLAEASEVEEINWMSACPSSEHPNVVALGANDGSVWVFQIDVTQKDSPLTVIQAYYLHTEASTAGAWSPDGKLLATVSEDSSLYVWDVFSDAASVGVVSPDAQSVVGLTGLDERFKIEGGLFCVAIAPNGAFVAVGGPEGQIRIIGLPTLGSPATPAAAGVKTKKAVAASAGQSGQILGAVCAGSDNVETLSFSSAPLTLLAAGNVDGSITLFDTAHRFATRRRIEAAHEEEDVSQAVVKVEFVRREGPGAAILRSVGYDGVLKAWDARGGTAAPGKGLVDEWKGHRGGGDGGGILGFVQGGGGDVVVTAGDDGVALVFKTPI